MKNVENKKNLKKQDNKKEMYQDKNGAFLSVNEIHGKGLNFFGTNFREE